jgi:hypothetical protein
MTLREKLYAAFDQPHWRVWQARSGPWPINDLVTDVLAVFTEHLKDLETKIADLERSVNRLEGKQ